MTFELLQHVIVTGVALVALSVVFRRVTGVVRDEKPKCDSCPSATTRVPRDTRQATPMTLVRRSQPR